MKKIIFVIILIILISISLFSQTGNPDKPLKGKWDFRMTKIWEIEDAGTDVIGGVQNIRAAKDGRIYIVDSKNLKIYIFSKDGKFISSFGRKGEGPGEIRVFSMGDQLFVVNRSAIYVDRGRIHYFSLDGAYKKSIIIPSSLRPRCFVSEDVFVSAPPTVADPRQKKAKIKLYNLKEQAETVISEFYPFDKATDTQESAGGGRITVGIVIGNITPMIFVNYRDGKIYYGKSDSYKIDVVDLKGKELFGFYMEGRKQKKVSSAFKKELAAGLGDIPQKMVENIINGLPEHASFFQQIEVDKNGLIYVLVSDPDGKSIQAVDIFSPEGKYLYASEIKVEEGHSIQNIYLRDSLLVLAIEDEEDNPLVAKYSINLPTGH